MKLIPAFRNYIRIAASIIVCAIGGAAASAETAPAAQWDESDLNELRAATALLSSNGLSLQDYDFAGLDAAIAEGDAVKSDNVAGALFSKIAIDLRSGVTPVEKRIRWRVLDDVIGQAEIAIAAQSAAAANAVAATLSSFEPDHAEYRALKDALQKAAGDENLQAVIKVNMERWRWMPGALGADYILVNAPAYEAIIVRNGELAARRRVIVGAKKTPTWQFSALVTGVAFNPTWFVPPSIVAENVGALMKKKPREAARLGYYSAVDGGVRQKPGPKNALGEMKLIMPNPYGIFLHDTPARDLFERENRALSHGCIRVDDALAFAAAILGPQWNEETLKGIVATNDTTAIELETPLPVYVGYFTASAAKDAGVTLHPDIYGLDRAILAERGVKAVASPTADEVGECPPG